MAVIKAVSSKAGIGHAIDYVTKKEKTEEKLVSGLHCEPETVKEEMQATKELWGKTDGRTYKHYVQSYHEDEEITPEQAHKNAVELAEHTKAWKGHEVLIATHIDKGHIHTHFIVNSVNYENGHKLQWSKHDLKDLKERCNEQSREQGLHVPEKGKTFAGEVREETVAWSKDTYQLLKQAEQGKVKSYVQDIALAVLDCKETATSRETFIRLMNERGYGVDWQDSHKYISELKQSVELLKNSNELLQDAISGEIGSLKDEVKENTVQEVRKALQANIEAIQRATKLLEKQSDTLTSVMKQKIRELEESKNSFFRYEGLKLYLFWGGMVCNILVFLMLLYGMLGK